MIKAPQGADKQNPLSTEASETPARWQEHLFLCSPSSENLEVPAEKAGTLQLKSRKKNCSGADKKRDRKARLSEAPAGDSVGSHNLNRDHQKLGLEFRAARHAACRSPVHMGSRLKGRKNL